MQSPSFLRLSYVEDKKYLICSQNLDEKKRPYNFDENGWRKLAKKIIFPKEMITPTAQMCVKKDFGNGFSQAHRTCNKIFDLQYTKIKANMAKKKH